MSIGDLCYDPRGDITWRGAILDLTCGERIILGSLVRDLGRYISTELLRERLGHEGDSNVPQALICRIRRKMRAISEPPIETMAGIGYRWRIG